MYSGESGMQKPTFLHPYSNEKKDGSADRKCSDSLPRLIEACNASILNLYKILLVFLRAG